MVGRCGPGLHRGLRKNKDLSASDYNTSKGVNETVKPTFNCNLWSKDLLLIYLIASSFGVSVLGNYNKDGTFFSDPNAVIYPAAV